MGCDSNSESSDSSDSSSSGNEDSVDEPAFKRFRLDRDVEVSGQFGMGHIGAPLLIL